jgi:hypothetical protein
MNLQQGEASVDAFNESEFAGKQMKGADATVGNAMNAVANLVVNVAGGEDGLRAATQVGFIEAAVNPPLAVAQLAVYSCIHLKTLVAGVSEETVYSSNAPETPRVFEFFQNSDLRGAEFIAFLRPSEQAAATLSCPCRSQI